VLMRGSGKPQLLLVSRYTTAASIKVSSVPHVLNVFISLKSNAQNRWTILHGKKLWHLYWYKIWKQIRANISLTNFHKLL